MSPASVACKLVCGVPTDPVPSDRVASWIADVRAGHADAMAALFPLVYAELRRLAAAYLRRERPGQTLQATALVHEAYLRLLREREVSWRDRAHFRALAARAMRQVLIERARARKGPRRGGGAERVTLDEGHLFAPQGVDVEALDEALSRFEALDPVRARIVELRFYGGLSVEETAEVMGISPATVKRGWALARAWLRAALGCHGHDA